MEDKLIKEKMAEVAHDDLKKIAKALKAESEKKFDDEFEELAYRNAINFIVARGYELYKKTL